MKECVRCKARVNWGKDYCPLCAGTLVSVPDSPPSVANNRPPAEPGIPSQANVVPSPPHAPSLNIEPGSEEAILFAGNSPTSARPSPTSINNQSFPSSAPSASSPTNENVNPFSLVFGDEPLETEAHLPQNEIKSSPSQPDYESPFVLSSQGSPAPSSNQEGGQTFSFEPVEGEFSKEFPDAATENSFVTVLPKPFSSSDPISFGNDEEGSMAFFETTPGSPSALEGFANDNPPSNDEDHNTFVTSMPKRPEAFQEDASFDEDDDVQSAFVSSLPKRTIEPGLSVADELSDDELTPLGEVDFEPISGEFATQFPDAAVESSFTTVRPTTDQAPEQPQIVLNTPKAAHEFNIIPDEASDEGAFEVKPTVGTFDFKPISGEFATQFPDAAVESSFTTVRPTTDPAPEALNAFDIHTSDEPFNFDSFSLPSAAEQPQIVLDASQTFNTPVPAMEAPIELNAFDIESSDEPFNFDSLSAPSLTEQPQIVLDASQTFNTPAPAMEAPIELNAFDIESSDEPFNFDSFSSEFVAQFSSASEKSFDPVQTTTSSGGDAAPFSLDTLQMEDTSMPLEEKKSMIDRLDKSLSDEPLDEEMDSLAGATYLPIFSERQSTQDSGTPAIEEESFSAKELSPFARLFKNPVLETSSVEQPKSQKTTAVDEELKPLPIALASLPLAEESVAITEEITPPKTGRKRERNKFFEQFTSAINENSSKDETRSRSRASADGASSKREQEIAIDEKKSSPTQTTVSPKTESMSTPPLGARNRIVADEKKPDNPSSFKKDPSETVKKELGTVYLDMPRPKKRSRAPFVKPAASSAGTPNAPINSVKTIAPQEEVKTIPLSPSPQAPARPKEPSIVERMQGEVPLFSVNVSEDKSSPSTTFDIKEPLLDSPTPPLELTTPVVTTAPKGEETVLNRDVSTSLSPTIPLFPNVLDHQAKEAPPTLPPVAEKKTEAFSASLEEDAAASLPSANAIPAPSFKPIQSEFLSMFPDAAVESTFMSTWTESTESDSKKAEKRKLSPNPVTEKNEAARPQALASQRVAEENTRVRFKTNASALPVKPKPTVETKLKDHPPVKAPSQLPFLKPDDIPQGVTIAVGAPATSLAKKKEEPHTSDSAFVQLDYFPINLHCLLEVFSLGIFPYLWFANRWKMFNEFSHDERISPRLAHLFIGSGIFAQLLLGMTFLLSWFVPSASIASFVSQFPGQLGAWLAWLLNPTTLFGVYGALLFFVVLPLRTLVYFNISWNICVVASEWDPDDRMAPRTLCSWLGLFLAGSAYFQYHINRLIALGMLSTDWDEEEWDAFENPVNFAKSLVASEDPEDLEHGAEL